MEDIFILVDYLDRFETKVPSIPYRSGLDKNILKTEFLNLGYKPIFLNYSEIDFSKINFKNKYVIYTSIEDSGLFYKDFIEDVIWGVNLQGGVLIPRLELFRAHHNKVFMEVLRHVNNIDKNITSQYFGSLTELIKQKRNFKYPLVIKSASGAGSKGVKLVKNYKDLIKAAKVLSNTNYWFDYLTEKVLYVMRLYQTKKTIKTESIYRKKIITQNFIPSLKGDYKILIFGDIYYIFQRHNRKNDFRASGSGPSKYLYGKKAEIPIGIFNYANNIYEKIGAPNLALDIAFSQGAFYLIEFQAISFGTIGQYSSNEYFKLNNNGDWEMIEETIPLEKVYAQSIIKFIKTRNINNE